MATESASSVDVFVKPDSVNGDRLIIRHVNGSEWVTMYCDSNGNLIFLDTAGTKKATMDITTGTLAFASV